MKWLKFHTSYIFAYATAQTELPPPPFKEHDEGEIVESENGLRVGIIGGDLGRAIRQVMNRGRSGNWSCRRCAYDILMSKLGMPPATEEFVASAFKDHKKALTKVIEPVDVSQYNTFVLQRVKAKIGEICEKLFKGKEFTHKDPIPSLRACYENKLGNGGGFGELCREYHDSKRSELRPNGESYSPCSSVLFGMVETTPGNVIEIRFHDWEPLVTDFQDFIDSQWVSRVLEPLEAIPCPILEPLKVRMITKGQAAEYYRTIEIQKFMHSTLKKHPIFEYIGHPIDDESWAKAFKTKLDLPENKFYVSGDYKGATDNLNPELSLHAWDCIAQYSNVTWCGEVKTLYDTPYYILGRKALCGHQLHYPSGDLSSVIELFVKILNDEISEEQLALPEYQNIVKQTWGQLMGSPMSFPILCIVNAAASLAALEQPFTRDYPMKVNGDDIAFIADHEEYETWKEVTGMCGLEFSLGKNYTSREFIVMNSELRRPSKAGTTSRYIVGENKGSPDSDDDGWRTEISWREHPKSWKLEGFLNQSILYHKVKKGMEAGQQKDVYWTDLQSLSHEAIHGLPESDQWKVLSIFLEQHKSVIEEIPANCNKWFPCSLGGAGVAIPATKTLTELCSVYDPERLLKQRKQAAFLACDPKARLKRVTRSKQVVGQVGELLKETLEMSNSQAPARLVTKPLNREQKTMLGGKTLLGYLVRGMGALSSEESVGGELRKESRTKKEPTVADLHARETRFLRNKYTNITRKALSCSLQPMNLENIAKYQEHLCYASYLELVRETPTSRAIDIRRYRALTQKDIDSAAMKVD